MHSGKGPAINKVSNALEHETLGGRQREGERLAASGEADLILINGSVYTAGSSGKGAEAVAVANGRIVCVGSGREALSWSGPATEVIDLKGSTVLPGFHDGHIHAVAAAYARLHLSLFDVSESRELLLRRLSRFVSANPERTDYFGMGWDPSAFSSVGPRREDIDAVCPSKPVLLLSNDLHTAWANSAALQKASILKDTPDPPGGMIVRDDEGQPTGWLKEPPAFRLVLRVLAAPHPNQLKKALLDFFQALSAEGITSIFQPGIEFFDQEKMIGLLAELEAEGGLPLRVTVGYRCGPQYGLSSVPSLLKIAERYQGRLLKTRAAKIFLDGVLEAHTAELLEPYEGRPGWNGSAMWDPELLEELVSALYRERIQVHLHAVGDGAVRRALDSCEKAVRLHGSYDSRFTVAHLELADPRDIRRFRGLGAIACFQPTWFHVTEGTLRSLKASLGERRSRELYAMGSFLAEGASVSCGSDFPVGTTELMSFRPLDGIEMGHTRCALGDPRKESYGPAQRISVREMIEAYTSRTAFQLFQEHEVGSIEPGRLADLVILSQDIQRIPPHRIHETRVLLTLLEGRQVHRDPSL